ncbi:cellulose binding domain-containing protein [Polymorphospora sp. NPDC051019]|uniref:cellulose binding domain-containing protein n=1 Tax=Polymorphospora sp. NPDC051019 TaxID=3155725 RepID=UPI003426EEAB
MIHKFGVLLAAATVAVTGWATIAGATVPAAAPAPAQTSPPACPPVLPINGLVTASTATSLTVTYSIMLSPPCGYDPPITVSLFASRTDAEQWRDPVATAVSGPQRYGTVTVTGLTPDTEYWFRLSDVEGRQDRYVLGGPARTAAQPVCTATATITSAWDGGFVASVTVRNTAAERLDGWRVWWRWPGDERIQTAWNAVPDGTAAEPAVRDAGHNATLPPGGSATFGLLVTTSAAPATVALSCGR